MYQLIVRLLGSPEIAYGEQIVKIPRRRSRALLFYMLCTQTPQPRERLLALLCGEMDERSARHTFKTLLAEVRALLRNLDPSVEWIIGDTDQLTLNHLAPLWIDTEVFETNITAHPRNLTSAIKLYRGDFLDGFFLKDAPAFESWTRSTRDHFLHLYIDGLRRLAEVYETQGQILPAIDCTQTLLHTDPFLEEEHARLMRLFWISGNRVEALRQYERLCDLFAEELGIKPSTSSQKLYEQIAQSNEPSTTVSLAPVVPGSTGASASSPLPVAKTAAVKKRVPPLLGRNEELAWVQKHLTDPDAGAVFLLLQGEAGVGKTRLLDAVVEHYGSAWRVLRGRFQEVEQDHPYHALLAACRQSLHMEDLAHLHMPRVWLNELVCLLPDLFSPEVVPEVSVSGNPTQVADAFVALLNQLATPQRPLLLVLDDLHWADATTIALLGHLTQHVQRGRVFLLGAARSGHATKRLAPLCRSGRWQRSCAALNIARLSSQDIATIASFVLADQRPLGGKYEDPGGVLRHICYQYSEGNPFLALEWLQLARQALSAGDKIGNLSALPTPEAVRVFVQAQVERLSTDAAILLDAATVLGNPFDPLAAARMAGLSRHGAIASLRELIEDALIVDYPMAGHGLCAFAHHVIRDVLLEKISPAQRSFFLQSFEPPVNDAHAQSPSF